MEIERNEREHITPELVLVCPELAALARPGRWEPYVRLGPREPSPVAGVKPARRLSFRLALLAAMTAFLLGTATLTFAQTHTEVPQLPVAATREPATVVVPDVVRQPYAFAKGILDDAGLPWRVEGPVEGYATNIVAAQEPAAGARVSRDGAPVVVLRLERNPAYPERGLPQSSSD